MHCACDLIGRFKMSLLTVFVENNSRLSIICLVLLEASQPFGIKKMRDIRAEILTEVCSKIEVEPHLERLSGELLALRTSISDDKGRFDIPANGVWGGRFEKAFFDVRVFNPCAKSNSGTLPSVYRKHEVEKKRCYEQRIRKVKHSSFTPFVVSCTGGIGKLATTFYKDLRR